MHDQMARVKSNTAATEILSCYACLHAQVQAPLLVMLDTRNSRISKEALRLAHNAGELRTLAIHAKVARTSM